MDYLTLLKDEFERRTSKNKRYSVRAFAADLSMSPAYISMLFSGQRNLNESRAREIAAKIGWSSEKQKLFTTLARLASAKTKESREAIQGEVDELIDRNKNFDQVKIDTFRMVSKWYHAALYELAHFPDFDPDPSWITKKIGATPIEAELAFDRLVRLGFLKKDKNGVWQRSQAKLEIEEIPSKVIKAYHKGILKLAGDSIDQQEPEVRDFASLTIAIAKSNVPEAKKRLKQFIKDMSSFLTTGKRDAIYQISYQFFRIDRD